MTNHEPPSPQSSPESELAENVTPIILLGGLQGDVCGPDGCEPDSD